MRGEGCIFVNNAFHSQMDTESWCRVHFVGGYFDYIVDAVSLFAFMPTLKYKTANDELDEKSNAKHLELTRSQGKVLASLHNIHITCQVCRFSFGTIISMFVWMERGGERKGRDSKGS